MPDRIKEAAVASRQAGDAVERAVARLALFDGRVLNGYGVYADPSVRRSDLVDAKAAIDEAIRIMSSTQWPTSADYDAAE